MHLLISEPHLEYPFQDIAFFSKKDKYGNAQPIVFWLFQKLSALSLSL